MTRDGSPAGPSARADRSRPFEEVERGGEAVRLLLPEPRHAAETGGPAREGQQRRERQRRIGRGVDVRVDGLDGPGGPALHDEDGVFALPLPSETAPGLDRPPTEDRVGLGGFRIEPFEPDAARRTRGRRRSGSRPPNRPRARRSEPGGTRPPGRTPPGRAASARRRHPKPGGPRSGRRGRPPRPARREAAPRRTGTRRRRGSRSPRPSASPLRFEEAGNPPHRAPRSGRRGPAAPRRAGPSASPSSSRCRRARSGPAGRAGARGGNGRGSRPDRCRGPSLPRPDPESGPATSQTLPSQGDRRPQPDERRRQDARVVRVERRDDLAPSPGERGRHEGTVRDALGAGDPKRPLEAPVREPHADPARRTARAALFSSTSRKTPSGPISACRRSSSQAGRIRVTPPSPS